MLDQAPTAPDRIPVTDGILQMYWLDAASSPLTIANLTTQFAKIPAAIREQHLKPYQRFRDNYRISQYKTVSGGREFMFDQFASGFGRNAGDIQWSGVYLTASADRIGSAAAGTLAGSSAQGTVIHEFAHHIDYTWGVLSPGAPHPEVLLTERADFLALWNEVLPSIASGLYGRTNIREWFAELFLAQITGDATLFTALAGSTTSQRASVRALFTSRLPMPAFTW